MRALILIAASLFLGYMAMYQTQGLTHAYAAAVAAGSLLLSLR
jgi:hypothetical protein